MVERMRLTAAGDLQVITGNLVIGTGGKGIDFAAQTQSSATTGSELLNHYEEGTFTPGITDGSNAGATSFQVGRYTRIGNRCCCDFAITLNASTGKDGMTGSAAFLVSGMPFTSKANFGQAQGAVRNQGFTAADDKPFSGELSKGPCYYAL